MMETIETLRKELDDMREERDQAYRDLVWVALTHMSAGDDGYTLDHFAADLRGYDSTARITTYRQNLVKHVQKFADQRRIARVGDHDRAPCPLCGERPVPSPHYKPGWALPAGLGAHLNGLGRTRMQCVVMEALDKQIADEFAAERAMQAVAQ